MLQADNIAYALSAVQSVDDIISKVDDVDKETCHTVVLLNCGSSEDLIGMSLSYRTQGLISPLPASDAGVRAQISRKKLNPLQMPHS